MRDQQHVKRFNSVEFSIHLSLNNGMSKLLRHEYRTKNKKRNTDGKSKSFKNVNLELNMSLFKPQCHIGGVEL